MTSDNQTLTTISPTKLLLALIAVRWLIAIVGAIEFVVVDTRPRETRARRIACEVIVLWHQPRRRHACV